MGAAWPFSTVFSHGEPNWLLEIASLTALVIVLQATTSRRRAIRLGWIFATIWLCGTFWWLYISMHTYAGLDPILTAVAITMDIGDPKQGHTANKTEFAARLSRVVLHDVYQKSIDLWSGPLFKSAEVAADHITLTFDQASGLKARSGKLEGFAIAAEDKKFVWADARIEGDKVIVSSAEIKAPKAVRYSWAANPKGNLVNAANLPASPFSSE